MTELHNLYQNILKTGPTIILGIAVFLVFILVSWVIKNLIAKRVKPLTKNPLLAVFLGKLVAFIITTSGFVLFLDIIGLAGIAKHIIAGAGITTFIIGFAFKDIGENFLSGIIMAFKSPLRVGDLIETNGIIGYVNDLNMRDSVIKTLDGKDVYIPNSQILKMPLSNYTIDGFLRYEIVIGIDFSSDIKKTIDIIYSTLSKHPSILQGEKKAVVFVDEIGVSTVNVKVLYWIDTFNSKSKVFHLKIKSEIIIAILEELSLNNVYLPADIIEVKNYNDNVFLSNQK